MVRTKHGQQAVLADKPEHAVADVEDALSMWPDTERAYLLQHFYGFLSLAQAELYMGRPDLAIERLKAEDRLLRRSQLLRLLAFRLEHRFLCGRTHLALAAQASASDRDRHRKKALQSALEMEKIGLPMGMHYASALRSSLASLNGEEAAAIEHLERAVDSFAALESRFFAACCRRQLGLLRGGDAGDELIASAELWMA